MKYLKHAVPIFLVLIFSPIGFVCYWAGQGLYLGREAAHYIDREWTL